MKAVICRQWGEPSTLTLEDITLPAPQPGEVRVKIHACGVNFADTLMIAGLYQVKPPFPFSPGMEIAGEVTALGEGVTHLTVGQRVMGVVEYGGFAEEVNANALTLLPTPDNMDDVTAAAFPIAYGTSHVALKYRANLKVGETLLVYGAAGGVGLTAVEIGKRMGATVIACASTEEKLALTRQYGADHTINYTQESIRERVKELTNGNGADVIYDPVGGDAFDDALRCVAWGGRILVIGFASGKIPTAPVNMTLVKNSSIVGVYWGAYARKDPNTLIESLTTLVKWYSEGKLHPHISATYPLEQTAQAFADLMQRRSTGKVVVKMT
ncbi:MAG: hypothetical protein CUN56_09300 [Phototrophicales bacterium]|nr:MAG: hypothetical protein CUN56_09300 [Phototrophicales bacterium]RMG72880.1 MAG: NADPH:quinone oxidoreductase family protein [Chloroflexota bacterium]